MKKIILIIFILSFSSLITNAQWFTQQSGTSSALYDIEFISKNTGWCSGDGLILRTTNGGANWVNKLSDAPFKPYSGIHPVDSNIIYAVGYFRTFIKTTNGGENWNIIENGNPGEGDYYSVFFSNQNTGWAAVNYGSGVVGIRKTTDGGKTFTFGQTAGIAQDLHFKDSCNGVGVGWSSFIYKTTDGGLSWNSYSLVLNGDFYRVSFIDNFTGYTASHRAVYRTTNFGNDWDSVGYIPAFVYSISFITDSIGYVGTGFSILKTTNCRSNWLSQVSTGVVYNIHSFNDSIAWTCGNAGRIWHTINGGISKIINISNEIPSKFELYQNYANPFNPLTQIKYDLPNDNFVTIKIYDILGKELLNLVNEFKQAGSYSVTFDATNYPSGVYYYKIKTGSFVQVRMMILIK